MQAAASTLGQFSAQSDEGTQQGSGQRQSRTDQVYETLRDRLMSGDYAPRARLREESIATELQVSRTPVRSALVMLRADGLIENDDYGFRVVMPDLAALTDLYELRVAIEMRGIQRTIETNSTNFNRELFLAEVDRWRVLQGAPPAPTPRFVADDEQFHVTFASAAGNSALVEALQHVNDRIRSIRMYDYVTEDRITATIEEHLTIGDHFLAGRLELAKQALHEHIGDSMETVMQRATRAITNMVARGVI